MKITVLRHDEIDFHALASLTFKARRDDMNRRELTVEKLEHQFSEFLSNSPCRIVVASQDDQLIGAVLLYIVDDNKLLMNPGDTFGGRPVLSPDCNSEEVSEELVKGATTWAESEGFKKISFMFPMMDSLETDSKYESWYRSVGFDVSLKYVEMICRIDPSKIPEVTIPDWLTVKPVGETPNDTLYDCYLKSFEAGDARFFFGQTEEERREYFEESLGIDEARSQDSSMLFMKGDELIGFSLVLPYGEANSHISCMCLVPSAAGQGLGRLMLYLIMEKQVVRNDQTITLGTETDMRAHRLYEKNGFSTTEGFVEYVWKR